MSWLADAHGVLLDPAPTCAGFIVRFWPPNARGPGTPLRDPEGSAALIVPTHVTAEQFRALVGNRPGRYVLTQVGTTRKPLRAPAAVVVLDAGIELDAAIGTSALASILGAIDAAEQRTVTAVAQLAAQLVDHRQWIEREIASLREALRDVDARSIVALTGRAAAAANTSTELPRNTRVKQAPSRPAAIAVPTIATPAITTPTPKPPAPTAPTAPTAPATHADVAALFQQVSNELGHDVDDGRAALLDLIATLPPLPRAIFGASAHGPDELLAPFLRAARTLPRDEMIALLTQDSEFLASIHASLAASLEVPIDQVRAAWTEPDEHTLPPRLREAIAAPRR